MRRLPDLLADVSGPHGSSLVFDMGDATVSRNVLILVHGRNASAESVVEWGKSFLAPTQRVLAPQAVGYSWYPHRFLVSTAHNQPYLDSALTVLGVLVQSLSQEGIASSRIVLAGFSQGACLVSEYVKRFPDKYAGVAIMSGGLIGDEFEVQTDIDGDLRSTPLYLGADEQDTHIPWSRVAVTAHYFQAHNAAVELRCYHDLGHQIHPDAAQFLTSCLNAEF